MSFHILFPVSSDDIHGVTYLDGPQIHTDSLGLPVVHPSSVVIVTSWVKSDPCRKLTPGGVRDGLRGAKLAVSRTAPGVQSREDKARERG